MSIDHNSKESEPLYLSDAIHLLQHDKGSEHCDEDVYGKNIGQIKKKLKGEKTKEALLTSLEVIIPRTHLWT